MQLSSSQARGCAIRTARQAIAVPIARKALVIRAYVDDAKTQPLAVTPPSWLPEQAKPVLAWFTAEDVQLSSVLKSVTSTDLYAKVQPYAESPVAQDSYGWKKLPETINGRAAMIGFVAGALAELLGAGSLLTQLASAPQLVVLTLGLITAGSIIPVAKATAGGYLESLRDSYGLPEGVFTEASEKLHGRIAMLGLGSLLAIELVIGRALL